MPQTTKSRECQTLRNCVETLRLAKIQRHILICSQPTVSNCGSKQASLESWEYLKKWLKQIKRPQPLNGHPISIFRTKAKSLRIYCFGQIMVVYPDGVWYHQANPKIIERIIQKHLIGNQVVEEYTFFTHSLPKTSPGYYPPPIEA